MLSKIKPSIEKSLSPVASILSNFNPNVLTWLGLIPAILFFIFLTKHYYLLALISMIGLFFDMFDGLVARKYGKVTAFGEFLDSTLDRLSDFLIISAFGFSGLVSWDIVFVFLLFTFLISYSRSRAELASKGKIKLDVGIMERTERLLLSFVSLFVYYVFPDFEIYEFSFLSVMFVFMAVLSFITFVQRIVFASKKLS